jgi:hypothetical protein
MATQDITMVTRLDIDTALLQEAIALNEGQAVDEIIETALREYIQRRKQLKIIDLFGAIDYEDYDYKQQRQQAGYV